MERFHFAFGVSTSRRQRIARLTQCPWQPALFMTVCREISEPSRETGARSREDPCLLVQYGEGPRGEHAGPRLVVAADGDCSKTYMNHAG